MLYFIHREKPDTHGLPSDRIKHHLFYKVSRSLLGVVGGYFLFLKIS